MIINDMNGDAMIFTASATNFLAMRNSMIQALLDKPVIHTNRWQQLDISASAAHGTHEILNATLWYDMPETPQSAQQYIQPDLPWAEGHFQERVGGVPENPGYWHARWPYHAEGADLHLKQVKDWQCRPVEGYDHNYMERMWAGGISYSDGEYARNFGGYRFEVGDLGDVVEQLRRDPTTRQAYLPIWFPEDTGATAKQRVPCSLGYHFIIRDHQLHMSYYLRSCEIYRHFTNDVYMAVRLGQWVRDQVEAGLTYTMGQLSLHIVSLHAFVGDVPKIHKMRTDA
jgi:Thymidylate synthase